MCVSTAQLLIREGVSVSTAESCTGGMIAHKFTCVPGASKSYKGGFVAYSNELKIKILGVSPESINQYTEVSEQVAAEMAVGCMNITGSDIAISTTGYAQPYTENEQVAYIGIAYKVKDENSGEVTIKIDVEKIKLEYPKSRHRFIEYVTGDAYYMILERLSKVKECL